MRHNSIMSLFSISCISSNNIHRPTIPANHDHQFIMVLTSKSIFLSVDNQLYRHIIADNDTWQTEYHQHQRNINFFHGHLCEFQWMTVFATRLYHHLNAICQKSL